MEDFHDFIQAARDLNLEVALDLAYQCSMDHPYVKDHPEWFKWRPDGTIQYAENPPKKYQDVVPFNFETEDWQALWDELKSIVFFWIDAGVKVFRVDNPHTKPFGFWEWLIRETHKEHPEVVFLSEAFTRPNVLNRLAKIGFSQSYTYFTWRNTKQELVQYMNDLVETEVSDFLRPNFWPNTPDILPEYLQIGGRPAYVIRLVLAATLSSNYGIYGPAYELAVNEAIPGTEEYLASEKYEIRTWDYNRPDSLRQYIADLNQIRRDNAALHQTGNVTFHHVDNDNLLFYVKKTRDLSNVLFIVVNLDPFHTQAGTVQVPMQELGLATNRSYLIYDQLSEDKYIWRGEYNYVELNPHINPVHIFRVHSRMRREADFDYYL
jgi:starch synthase (maltosyl-transferring)